MFTQRYKARDTGISHVTNNELDKKTHDEETHINLDYQRGGKRV